MTVSGRTVVEIAFQRGAFDAQDTDKTTYALIFYMIGLIFVALREYFIRCVLALETLKILMVSSTTAVAINITFKLCSIKVFIPWWGSARIYDFDAVPSNCLRSIY